MTVRIEHNEVRTSIEIGGKDVSHCVQGFAVFADARGDQVAHVTLLPASLIAELPDEAARLVHAREPRPRWRWRR